MRISDCSSDVRSSELLFLLWLFDLPKRAWLKLHAIDLDRRGKRNQPCFDVRLHEFRIAVSRTAIATAPRCVVGDGVALLQMLDVADRVSQPSFSCRALIDDPATAISRRPAGDALDRKSTRLNSRH